MNDRPRGLGRGLSALLGEPVRTSEYQKPSTTPAWIPPKAPVADLKVVELASVQHAAPQPPQPPPQAAAPAQPPAQPAPATASLEPSPRGVPIELVQRNPNQPRKHFDEKELTELADSIRAHGVLQPILVRPIATAPGRYEIVAGERRWRAAQKAGLHTIPAVIRELDEVEVLEIGIIENVQRQDLNPIEEAQGYQALIDRFARTQQDIADSVGKSRPHIANMLRLLSLPSGILDMVRDGRLSAGHARAILTAPDPAGLAERAAREALSVREVERLASAAKDARDGAREGARSHHPAAPPIEKDSDTRALELQLSNALGLAVTIVDRSGQGEVRIAYKTLEQLDDVARRIGGR